MLRSIDRSSPLGLRDYTVLLLGTAYGLRASDLATSPWTTSIGPNGRLRSFSARRGNLSRSR